MPAFKIVEKTTDTRGSITSVTTTTTRHFLMKKPQVTTVLDYYEGDRHLYREVISNNEKVGYRP